MGYSVWRLLADQVSLGGSTAWSVRSFRRDARGWRIPALCLVVDCRIFHERAVKLFIRFLKPWRKYHGDWLQYHIVGYIRTSNSNTLRVAKSFWVRQFMAQNVSFPFYWLLFFHIIVFSSELEPIGKKLGKDWLACRRPLTYITDDELNCKKLLVWLGVDSSQKQTD